MSSGDRFGDGDRDDGLYGEPEGSGMGQWYDLAAARVRTPGLVLQIFGGISLALTLISVVSVLVVPEAVFEWQYKMTKDMNAKQPPENRQKLPPYEEFIEQQTIQTLVISIFQLAGSGLMFVGGMKMKALESYGLSMTGAIVATISICVNNCCCLSTPIGIWALVVLFNSDVKLAFARNPRRGG